jgi:hypothetical protein
LNTITAYSVSIFGFCKTGEGIRQAFQEFTAFLVKATEPDPDFKLVLVVNQPINHSCC